MSEEDDLSANRRLIRTVGDDEESGMLSINPITANLTESSNRSVQDSDDEDDASMILPTPEKLTISSKVTLLDTHKGPSETGSLFEKFKVQKELNFLDDGEKRDPIKEQRQGAGTSDFKSASQRQHPSVDFSQPKVPYEGSQEDDDWNLHLSSSLTCTNVTQEECIESKQTDNMKVPPPFLLQEIFSNVASSQNSHNGDSEPDLPATQRNPDLFMDSMNNSDYSDEDEIAPSQEPTQPLISIPDPLAPFGKSLFKSRSPLAKIHKGIKDESMEISESCTLSDTMELTEVPETQGMELQDDPDMNEFTRNESITELQESKFFTEDEDDHSMTAVSKSHSAAEDDDDHSVSKGKRLSIVEDEKNHSVAAMDVGDGVAEDEDNLSVAVVKDNLSVAADKDNLSVAAVKDNLSIAADKDNLSVAAVKESLSIAEDDPSMAIVDQSVVEDESHKVSMKDEGLDVDSFDKDQNVESFDKDQNVESFDKDQNVDSFNKGQNVDLFDKYQNADAMEKEHSLAKLQGDVEQQEVKELPETVTLIESSEIMQRDELMGTLEVNKFQEVVEENHMDELTKFQKMKKDKRDEGNKLKGIAEQKLDESDKFQITPKINKMEELKKTLENSKMDKEHEFHETTEINKVAIINELPETVEISKIDELNELPETVEISKMDELNEPYDTVEKNRMDELKEFQENVERNKMDEVNEFQESVEANRMDELNELPETVEMNKMNELKDFQEIVEKRKTDEEIVEISKMDELPETVLLETNKDENSSVKVAEPTIEDNISKKGVDEEVQVLMFPLPYTVKKLKHLNESPKKSAGPTCDISSPDEMSSMLKEVPFIESTDSTSSIPVHTVGTFTDSNDLNVLLKSLDLSVRDEKLETFSSQSGDSKEHVIFRGMATYKVIIKNKTVYQKFIPLGHGKVIESLSEVEVSPADSNSTTLSAKVSSFGSTPSGEMGDISSSISSKSSSSHSSISASQSNLRKSVLSQEALMDTLAFKTSTQKSGAVAVSFKSTGIFDESDINRKNQETGQFGQDTLSKFQSDDKIFRSPSVILPPIKEFHKVLPFKSGVVSTKLRRGRKRKEQKDLSLTISVSDNYEKPAKRPRGGKSDVDQNSFSPSSIQTFNENSDFSKRTVRKKSTNKNITTGRKRDSEKESIEIPDDNFDSETDSAPFGIILPGVRVMARWKDGYYYPAVVKSQESEGRWWIHFDDGSLRNVTEKNLLKISILQVGTNVLAQTSPDGFYDHGTVKSHFREGTQYGYVIEHETGLTKRYSRSSVILSTEQAKIITGIRPVAPPSSTINLENIIGGKRKRKSTSESEKGMGKGDSNLESTESSMSESVLPEKSIVEKAKSHQKKKGARQKYSKPNMSRSRGATCHVMHDKISTSSDISSSDIADDKEILDPKIRKSKMFIGYAFILSNAVRGPTPKGETDSSSDSTSVEPCDDRYPFDKEYLCKEILAGGGTVLETFEEAMKSKRKVFLLASTYLRTIKYIRCVAVNIPCITHHWVYNCCYTKTLQDYHRYLLPTGFSIIEDVVVEWHNKTNIFKGMKVVLTAEKKSDFVSIWTPVLLSANADLVQKWNLPSFSVPGMSFSVDLIITNASCPNNVITAAKRRKLPIVSSEWMIQSIIEGKLLAYDAHPKFKHDFKV